MIEFSTKSPNVQILQATLLVASPHDAVVAILKILGILTRKTCDAVNFQHSY